MVVLEVDEHVEIVLGFCGFLWWAVLKSLASKTAAVLEVLQGLLANSEKIKKKVRKWLTDTVSARICDALSLGICTEHWRKLRKSRKISSGWPTRTSTKARTLPALNSKFLKQLYTPHSIKSL